MQSNANHTHTHTHTLNLRGQETAEQVRNLFATFSFIKFKEKFSLIECLPLINRPLLEFSSSAIKDLIVASEGM